MSDVIGKYMVMDKETASYIINHFTHLLSGEGYDCIKNSF